MSRRVAVIGTGNIGRTLARRLAGAGAEVRIGARDPESLRTREFASNNPTIPVSPLDEAIAASDVVIVAIPGASLEAFIEQSGAAIGARVVLDATNRVGGETLHGLEHWHRLAPNAAVFRAFCTAGWETFADPDFNGVQADVFYCGPDGAAREVAEEIIEAIGVRPVRLGDVNAAALVDSVTRLWFTLVFDAGRGRNITLKLLERS